MHEYDSRGKHQVSQKWVYDKNNHCIEEALYISAPLVNMTYRLNEQGYILRSHWKSKGARDTRTENIYDKGKVICQSKYVGELLSSEEEWAYDSMGHVVYNRIQDPNLPLKVTTYTYEYDLYGNVTKSTISVNNVRKTFFEQVLVYY